VTVEGGFVWRTEHIFEHSIKPGWLVVLHALVLHDPDGNFPVYSSVWGYGGVGGKAPQVNIEKYKHTFRTIWLLPYYTVFSDLDVNQDGEIIWNMKFAVDDEKRFFSEVRLMMTAGIKEHGFIIGPWGPCIQVDVQPYVEDPDSCEPDQSQNGPFGLDVPKVVCEALGKLYSYGESQDWWGKPFPQTPYCEEVLEWSKTKIVPESP